MKPASMIRVCPNVRTKVFIMKTRFSSLCFLHEQVQGGLRLSGSFRDLDVRPCGLGAHWAHGSVSPLNCLQRGFPSLARDIVVSTAVGFLKHTCAVEYS